MRNRQDRAFLELGRDDVLDELIVFLVDVGGGFVNQDDLALLEEGSTDAEKLLFAD